MTRKNGRVAIRINGKEHQGWHKSQSDKVQKRLLMDKYIKVVDVNEYECKEIFKEKINYLAYLKITNALYQGDVKP